MIKMFILILLLLTADGTVVANATIPTEDLVLKRYQGSFIISNDHRGFDEFTFPLSMLEEVAGNKDTHNNRFFAPENKKAAEGLSTRLVYLITYRAHAGDQGSNEAEVTLTVRSVNDAPAAAVQTVTLAEDSSLAITLGRGDPDGGALTCTLISQPADGQLAGTALASRQ